MTANQLKYWDLQRQKQKDAADIQLASEKAKTEGVSRGKILSETQLNNLRSAAQEYENVVKKYDALKSIIEAGDYELGPGDTFKVDLKSRQEWKDIKSAINSFNDVMKGIKDVIGIGGLLLGG